MKVHFFVESLLGSSKGSSAIVRIQKDFNQVILGGKVGVSLTNISPCPVDHETAPLIHLQ